MTSIEWLYNDLFPKKLDGFSDDEWKKIDDAFKQAKEMHKQEIVTSFDFGFANGQDEVLGMLESRTHAEIRNGAKYYKETYQNQK